MPGLIVWVAIVAFVLWLGRAGGRRMRDYDRLLAAGMPARGILVQVDATGMRVAQGFRVFQLRGVLIDVEVPGRPPYEIRTSALIPSNAVRDVLPGVTVELRVDPSDAQKIAIIGPGVGLAPALVAPPPLG